MFTSSLFSTMDEDRTHTTIPKPTSRPSVDTKQLAIDSIFNTHASLMLLYLKKARHLAW